MKRFLSVAVMCMLAQFVFSQHHPYSDRTHYSRVFGHEKFYRLYLPQGYHNSGRRYPVIYFFHGWGGRHFKDDNAKLAYDKIQALTDKYQAILVMWDGNIDTAEPRPYNIGDHSDVKFEIQMKDYFIELIDHIDATCRTITDRQHRGIIGFSMGGFVSFFLAGKYPHKVCAAVSLAGSPEFFVGDPNNHTLFPVRYTFKNLQQVKTRMHNGDTDILYYLNEEVHAGAQWEGVPMSYYRFHGGHMIDDSGETKVFEMAVQFVTGAFKSKPIAQNRWWHYDLYQNFDIWDYTIVSGKRLPGFIYLKHVSPQGLGIYTQRWLPDGPPVESGTIRITTAPLYKPGKRYQVVQYSVARDTLTSDTVTSDAAGRLTINTNGSGYETGISAAGDPPDIVALDYLVDNKSRFLQAGGGNEVAIRLFNRGGENSLSAIAQVTIRTQDSTVQIQDSVVRINVQKEQRMIMLPPVRVTCFKKPPPHAEPPFVKIKLDIRINNTVQTDELTVPVSFDVPYFTDLVTDDGSVVAGKAYGTGNGNGQVNPGEQVILYTKGHRLRLYTEDPFVMRHREQLKDEIIPARWPDGFTLSSVIQIDPACPDGHVIDCLASYETKTFNPIERKLTWGKIRITVNR
jgi:enterochelin esterase-like enzyme